MQKLAIRNLAEEVEKQLLTYIREKELVPGSPLPSEKDLAADLGVSRNVVREALSRLRMVGIVESRKRRGMILGKPDILHGLARVIDAAILSAEDAIYLMELRVALEIGMTHLVYAGRTPENMDRLEAIVTEWENSKTYAKRVITDAAFHEQLFEIAGNPILTRFRVLLEPFFFRHRKIFGKQMIDKKNSHDHRKLLNALRHGTAEEFHIALRHHLSVHFAIRNKERTAAQ